MAKAGVVNVCIHKGLFAPSVEERFLGHGAYRFAGGNRRYGYVVRG
jgi:hypothetical protein